MMIMKILHLLNYVGRGGSESYIKNLINTGSDFEHQLLYNIDGGGVEDFQDLGVKTIQCPMKSPLDLRASKFLKNYVKGNDIDLVHTHFMRENGIAFLSKILGMKVPVINTRHMVSQISKKSAFLNKIFFTKNEKIIGVSSLVKERLIDEGAREEKILVLPPPIPLINQVEPLNKEKDEKWILSLGRFSEEKGILFFIDGLNELFKEIDNVRALIIGYGDLEDQMKRKIHNYKLQDKIEIVGYRSRPFDYLAAADLYVNHSKEEAFGLSIVEAGYCGAPLLITSNCGARDYFNEKNGSAKTFQYGNLEEFKEKALEILTKDDLANSLKVNAKKILDEDLNQGQVIKNIESLYEGVISESRKN